MSGGGTGLMSGGGRSMGSGGRGKGDGDGCSIMPADLQQREGRIVRQGNQNPEIRVLRYVTEMSFDGYSWQTVTRIVLPTASPGIFSAIMVGFGRAVGETMIVLMATGNTPILDLNPFNGFRTLSANVAVEIPEAPQFGTLYRVLFFAALLLFFVTFLVNTAAELVRQRLRRRYAQL